MEPRLCRPPLVALLSCLALSLLGCGKTTQPESLAATAPIAASAPSAAAAAPAAAPGAKVTADSGEPPNLFLGHIDPTTLGIPIYPGAKPSDGVSLASSGKDGNGQMVNLTTPDSFETVAAWYRAQLPAGAGNDSLIGTAHKMITFQASAQPNDAKLVTVATEGDHTSITLTAGHSVAAPAAAASTAGNVPGAADHADLHSLGLPVYGSVYQSSWAGNFSDDTQTTRQGNLSTHDPFDKVYSWYKSQLPVGSEEGGEAAAASHKADDGEHAAVFQIGTTANPKSKMVMITQGKGDDSTIIVLIDHITK